MGYNLLINGVYEGYNQLTNHLVTSWDIQVGKPPSNFGCWLNQPIWKNMFVKLDHLYSCKGKKKIETTNLEILLAVFVWGRSICEFGVATPTSLVWSRDLKFDE